MGMVNFLSMFCPELQKLLEPICDLTEKVGHLFGEEINRIPLKKIKCRLNKTPYPAYANKMGRFHLYSDTSKFATGSVLYQIRMENPN